MPPDCTSTSSAVNDSVTGQGFGLNFQPDAATSGLAGDASASTCSSSLSPSARSVRYMRLRMLCSGTAPWARRPAITASGTMSSAPLAENVVSSIGWLRSSPEDSSTRPPATTVSPLRASDSESAFMASSVLFTA